MHQPAASVPRSGPDPTPHRFNGHALKRYRAGTGVSRSTLARRAKLSGDALKAMERNLIRPSEAAFVRLCQALDVNVGVGRELFCGPGPADHRPMEFAVEASAAERKDAGPSGRRRTARLLMKRRGGRDAE